MEWSIARAKINLTLDVTGKRPDGYHDLRTIMHSVSLGDRVGVELRPGQTGIRVKTDKSYLPVNEKNTAYRAAAVFLEHTKIPAGADIEIIKKIPVGAGLGGGSADAAAALLSMNALTGAGLSRTELLELGKKVGADVPFCIMGGAALAEGIGEILTALPPMAGVPVVLCKPNSGLKTPEIFGALDLSQIKRRPDTEAAVRAVETGGLAALSGECVNVLSPVSEKKLPVIGEIKSELLREGAVCAEMSGSGSAVFALFSDGRTARAAYRKMKRKYPDTQLTELSGV